MPAQTKPLEVKQVKVGSLRPFPGNPRKISDKGLEKLQRSLEEFGFVNPIIAQGGTNMIIAGHQRLKAAKAAGLDTVPVILLDIDDATAKAYNIADNRLAQETEWDFAPLAELLQELDTGAIDMGLTGFDEDELERLMNWTPEGEGEIEEDEVPEPPEEPVTKLGDLWILGRHRLLCGDSTQAADVERLMDGKKADMVFTDPPYNINYADMKGKHERITNDNMAKQAFRDFLRKSLAHTVDTSYICCNWKTYPDFYAVLEEKGLPPKACIVWDKVVRAQNLDKYYKQHEFILYTGPFGGQKTVRGDVVTLQREKSDLHPTVKPVALVATFMGDGSKKGDVVLDLFGGSGSTLIAAEQTGRTCYTMELEPKYCDVIVERWETLTGEKATRG